jgi:hypothetical protein
MSRVAVWAELVCASCATTTAGRFTYVAVKRSEMKAEAVRQGWRFRYDECFCSKQCLSLYQEENGHA